jgi:hypothetical protein
VNSHLRIPIGFPPELARRAYQVGYMPWPAWTQPDAVKAVEAFRSLSLAITDGELGVRTARGAQTHYSTAKGDFVCSFGSLERASGEAWDDFVQRSCDEVLELVRDFQPRYPVVEECTIGFMLVWRTLSHIDKQNA